MIKKTYEKPMMCVVELRHRTPILTGSPVTLTGPNGSGSGSQDDDWYDLE